VRLALPAPRRPFLAAALAWPLAVVLYHWQAAWPGRALAGQDLRYVFQPLRAPVAAALRAGELPGWQRGVFLGYPLLADPQAAVFDFATWLTLPWDGPRALTLAALLHLVVAGWGMIWWMRQRGLGAAEGLLAALLFALGAKETAHLQHWTFAASTAWWPWMLAGLDGFRATARGRHLLLTAAAAALSWLGGSPQMAWFGTVVAGTYALSMAPELRRRRPADALLALAAAPLGLLLAGPLVLPAAELARLGPRGAGVEYRFAASWPWPDRWGLALLLLPRAYGGAWLRDDMNLWEATGYLAILPLGLLAATPMRRGGWLFALLGVLGVWLAFGEAAWLGLHRIFFHVLPGYGLFRNPTRSLMVTSFASALLAAEALAALRRPGGRRAGLRAGAALAAVGVVAALLPRAEGLSLDRAAAAEGGAVAALMALGGVAWLALRATALRRPAWAGPWALAPLLLCGSDLYRAFGGWNEVAPAAAEQPALADLAPWLPPEPGPRRVAVVARWGRTANAPLANGWEGATGYGPTGIGRVLALLEATRDDWVVPPRPLAEDPTFPRPNPASPLWPLLATPLAVADAPLPLRRLTALQPEWNLPTAAYAAPALPRVFWTGRWEVRRDDDLVEPMLRAASGEVAILSGPIPGLPPPGEPRRPVPAGSVKLGRDVLEAELDAPEDGLAVVLDPWFPGWSATVDGAPVPLVRADFAFMALPVKAGPHRVRLEYRSEWLRRGALVAAGTLAALLGVLAWRRRGASGASEAGV